MRISQKRIQIFTIPAELRKHAYETLPAVEWEGQALTVDQANLLYLAYFAENNPKAAEIQALIIPAKAYIRSLYPDEE